MKKNSQTVSALITALFITAIVATLATVMAFRQAINIRHTQLFTTADRAYLNLQGVEDWAISELIVAARSDAPETFPKVMPVISFQGAEISGALQDQLGLFNINVLRDPNFQPQFERLLQIITPNISSEQALKIAQSITAWLTSSNADEIYTRENPPYRAAHSRMAHISELRLVNGISNQIYLALAPYITALPVSENKININTAPMPVLGSLSAEMSESQAKAVEACRNEHGYFKDVGSFNAECIEKANITLDPGITLTTTSNYFLVNGFVKINNQIFNLSSLLQRKVVLDSQNKKTIEVYVLWQSHG